MKSSMLLPGGVDQPLAAHGHGDAVGAASASSDFAHQLVAGVLAGADDQPAGERVAAESKRIGRIGRDFRGRGHVCGICRVGRARESHAK